MLHVLSAAQMLNTPDLASTSAQFGINAATVTFGRRQFGVDAPKGNERPSGGVAVAELSPDECLVTGFDARTDFGLTNPGADNMLFNCVEEGHYENGNWVFDRLWNGDQTDYVRNVTSAKQVCASRSASIANPKI